MRKKEFYELTVIRKTPNTTIVRRYNGYAIIKCHYNKLKKTFNAVLSKDGEKEQIIKLKDVISVKKSKICEKVEK